MSIIVDDAQVPAHDRYWCHLASDASFDELHAFADRLQIPRRAFDGDHYDVLAERQSELVTAGAVVVTSRELVSRLHAAGLRRRKPRSAKGKPSMSS